MILRRARGTVKRGRGAKTGAANQIRNCLAGLSRICAGQHDAKRQQSENPSQGYITGITKMATHNSATMNWSTIMAAPP
jgi:hypothetical protein